MSHDQHLRDQTRIHLTNNPNAPKLESHQATDHDRGVINAEIDRINRENEERRKRQG